MTLTFQSHWNSGAKMTDSLKNYFKLFLGFLRVKSYSYDVDWSEVYFATLYLQKWFLISSY